MEFNPAFKAQELDPKVFLDQYFEGQRRRQMQEMEKMPFLPASPLEMTPNSNDRFMRSLMQEEQYLPFGGRGFADPNRSRGIGTPPINPNSGSGIRMY